MGFADLLASSGRGSCLPCCCLNPFAPTCTWKNKQACCVCAQLCLFCFVHVPLRGVFIPQNVGSHGSPVVSSLLPSRLPLGQAGASRQHGQPAGESRKAARCLGAMRLFLSLPHFGGLQGPSKQGLSGASDGCPALEAAGWARLTLKCGQELGRIN